MSSPAPPAAPVIALCRSVSPSWMVRSVPAAMATASTCSFSRSLRLLDRWVVPADTSIAMLSWATKDRPSAIRVCACAALMCSAEASGPMWPTSSCKPTLCAARSVAAVCKLLSSVVAVPLADTRLSKLATSKLPWLPETSILILSILLEAKLAASALKFARSPTTTSDVVSRETWLPPSNTGNPAPPAAPPVKPCKSVLPNWTVRSLAAAPLSDTASILIFSRSLRLVVKRFSFASTAVSLLPAVNAKPSICAKPWAWSSVRCSLIGGLSLPA